MNEISERQTLALLTILADVELSKQYHAKQSDQYSEEVWKLKSELRKMTEARDSMASERDALQETATSLRAALDNVEGTLEDVRQEFDDLQTRFSTLVEENQDFIRTMDSVQQDYNRLETKYNEKQKQLTVTFADCASLSDANKKLEAQLLTHLAATKTGEEREEC